MLQDRPEFTYPSYRVTVSEVGGPFSVQLPATANRDGGILTVNAVGLTAGTEYNVKIQGVTSLGQLEDQVTLNEFTRPNPPINGRFSELNGATVFLEWNPPADGRLDGYIVEHGTETQDPTTFTQAVLPLGQTSYAVSGLNPLIPYVIGLVSYRDSTDTFSDFAELLQEGNSNLVINRADNECASRPCQNDGQCFGESGGRSRCECINGFRGTNCETATGPNTCATSPCLNGATCVDEFTMFSCSCLPGFIADNDCASRPCQERWPCFGESGARSRCECITAQASQELFTYNHTPNLPYLVPALPYTMPTLPKLTPSYFHNPPTPPSPVFLPIDYLPKI
eukprot:XP_011664510.1 PREDICTED: aggrecan core protein-like [Strongylocentrotus purpuratus]